MNIMEAARKAEQERLAGVQARKENDEAVRVADLRERVRQLLGGPIPDHEITYNSGYRHRLLVIRDQQLAFAQDICFIVGKPSLEVLGVGSNSMSATWHRVNALADLARITPCLPLVDA